ncbi:MAG TPA: ATP-grasp domain-containing protein [Methylibium sp.]|nr:ATP-grasp domain-containing protein [Methylibium sp.]
MSLRLWVGEYLSGDRADAAPPSLLEAGVQMRDALLEDLLRWRAASPLLGVTVSYAQGPGVPAFGRSTARAVPPREGESALDFLPREGRAQDLVWLVAPESGGVLERLARSVDPRRWIGCTPDAIALAGSKRATLARLAARGACTPLAFETRAAAWVVKPDDGAGSTDTRRHATRAAAEADLAARIERDEPATLEAWVDGEPLSLSLLCREGAAPELLAINRQRIEIDGAGWLRDAGVSIARIPLDDPRAAALAALAAATVQALPGLSGFVGIDLVWHAERGAVAIEVNPRVTCAYAGLSAALGRNLAAEIVTAHLEAIHVAA